MEEIKFPRTLSADAKSLLSGLLIKDPNKRSVCVNVWSKAFLGVSVSTNTIIIISVWEHQIKTVHHLRPEWIMMCGLFSEGSEEARMMQRKSWDTVSSLRWTGRTSMTKRYKCTSNGARHFRVRTQGRNTIVQESVRIIWKKLILLFIKDSLNWSNVTKTNINVTYDFGFK